MFLEYREVLTGQKLVGQDLVTDSGLEWAPLTDIEPDDYHIMVSKKYPQGKELVQLLNQGIARLRASGKLKSMMSRVSR